MSSRRTVRRLVVAVLVGILVGGGLMAVTPAGAEVSSALATNWKKIWNKELKPQADKRYYTKKKSDKRYEAAGSGYTKAETYSKAEADAKYQPKGNYALNGSSYTKAESDAKYAPLPSLIKGTYFMTTTAAAGGAQVGSDISFGYTLPAPPTVHYIPMGMAPPADCPGTIEAPDAVVGHLCVFERLDNNASGQNIYNATGSPGLASRMGALLNATSTAAGGVFVYGSWAVRPASVSGTGARPSPSVEGTPSLGR